MNERIWDRYITEQDRQVVKAAGYGQKLGFGKRPAVLVIDVQYNFTGDEPMPILEAVKKYRTCAGEVGWKAIPPMARVIEAARQAGAPVIYTKSERRPDFLDAGVSVGKSSRGREGTVLADTRATEFVAEIAPLPNELVLRKAKPSGFFASLLMSYLNLLKVDSLIVMGCSTSGCVRATVVDAFSYNFPTTVVEDATFDRMESSHAITLFDIYLKYGDVVKADEVVAHLTGGDRSKGLSMGL